MQIFVMLILVYTIILIKYVQQKQQTTVKTESKLRVQMWRSFCLRRLVAGGKGYHERDGYITSQIF